MTLYSRFGRLLAPAAVAVSGLLAGGAVAAPGGPFTLVTAAPKTLTPRTLAAAQRTATSGHVSADGKTLTFGQKIVRLVAVTGPENDMLSYRIGGKRNPTLVVPRGATVKMLFVNTDDDMLHDLRLGAVPTVTRSAMASYVNASVGTPGLAHKTETVLHGEEMTLRAPATPGTYAYLCTVRGHAEGGMAGKMIVR
jgi:rusticyanin